MKRSVLAAATVLLTAFFLVVASAFAYTYYLGPGNDTFYDNDQNNNIYGEGGNDNIFGRGGNDDIFGGPGADYPMNGNDGYSDRIDADGGSGDGEDGLDGGPGLGDTCIINYQVDWWQGCEILKGR